MPLWTIGIVMKSVVVSESHENSGDKWVLDFEELCH
jgi:hypothetical protein